MSLFTVVKRKKRRKKKLSLFELNRTQVSQP
jgi:hypothetical protein